MQRYLLGLDDRDDEAEAERRPRGRRPDGGDGSGQGAVSWAPSELHGSCFQPVDG